MQFIQGNNYLINYGAFTKLSTFLHREDDKNIFIDLNGKFAFSDSFLSKGTLTVEHIDDSEEF